MKTKKTYVKHFLWCALILTSSIISAQKWSVEGKVTSLDNTAINGATITLLGTTKGGYTNENGKYKIENLTSNTYFLKVSFLGYQTITKKVVLNANNLVINFTLYQISDKLEEVIISSANRRFEKLQKTAASVSAISTKEISQLQIKQISELNSIAPNFRTYDDGATGGYTMIASRGITTIDNKPIVGVYIDDIPYFNGFSFPLALQDLKSIEVLRGPQGTLYGRNSLAGVLNIKTKSPKNKVSGYLTSGYGNLNAKEFSFAFNAPLIKDKLLLRASTNIADRDGFVKNEFNNKDLQNRKVVDANIRFTYFATDKLKFNLQYNVQRKESDAYVYSVASPQISLQDILKNNPYKVNFDMDVLRQVVFQNIALHLKYDLPSFRIHSIFAYQKNAGDRRDEYDYTPFDIQSAVGDNVLHNFSQEFRLVSTNDSSLQWTAGVFLYHNKTSQNDNFIAGKDISLVDPTAIPNTRSDMLETIQKGIALYGQATYTLNDKVSFTGGLRLDYEKNTVDIERTYNIAAFPPSGFVDAAEFTSFSPKGTIGYNISNEIFAFGSIARGYKPGGINQFITDKEKAKFNPEQSLNYEIGLKSTILNNTLKLNLTGFYTSYTGQQIFTLLDLSTFAFGIDNIGESRIFGLEFEGKAAISKGLSLGMNLGYLNAKVSKYNEVIVNPSDGTVILEDRSGKTLPVSPEFNGNINVNFVQPLSKKINLESSLDYNYQSDIYFDIPNNSLQPSYGLLNGRLGITSQTMDLFIWAKNLTNEAYYGYGYGVGTFNAAAFALPRTFGANITLKF